MEGGDEKENYHPPHTVKGEGGHVANLRCTAAELESEIVIAVGVKEVASCDAEWLTLRLHPSRYCIQQRATTMIN